MSRRRKFNYSESDSESDDYSECESKCESINK